VEGRVRVEVAFAPRGRCHARPRGHGVQVVMHERFELDLQLSSSLPLEGLRATFELGQGERAHFMLRWKGGHFYHHPKEPHEQVESTARAWRAWARCITYEGPRKDLVRRSAITIKLLDNFENGAVIAAPTTSLPEWIGADLNWDYRYVWIRDAAFSVYALTRIGLTSEAGAFLGWVLDQVERHTKPKLLYTVLGDDPEPEWEDPTLEGYRRSPPVRFGNGAADQRQDDVYGEIIDCAYQWVRHRETIRPALWQKLCGFVERAARDWDGDDHGIWELRNEGRPYTYSAALCHVAVDRMAKLGEQLGSVEQCGRWRATAEEIRDGIIERAWDEKLRSFTMWLGGGGLDASILCLPLRRVVEATHPRMEASINTIAERLSGGGGLIHRFLDSESPEPLPKEGAFLLCSFWLVENLVLLGRKEEAMELFESLCDRATPLGLLSEEIDPSSGAFLGNFPQAFSHIGVIAAGVRLGRAFRG
jgi:alpha,alpha-trehalase